MPVTLPGAGANSGYIAPNSDQITKTYNDTSATDLANALKQLTASGTNATNVQGLVNTGNANVADIQGKYGLQDIGLKGQYDLTSADLAGKYGLTEAQTQTLPGLMEQARKDQVQGLMMPYLTGIMGQLGPLLGNVSGMIGGMGSGAGTFTPNGSGGTLTTAQGVNVTPAPVANTVINPGEAGAMMGANTGQGNAAAANQIANLPAGASDAFSQQMAQQISANNSSNLNSAATQFLGQLAQGNSQQALSAAQLQELARSNVAKQQLGYAGVPIGRLGSLLNMVTGITHGAMGS